MMKPDRFKEFLKQDKAKWQIANKLEKLKILNQRLKERPEGHPENKWIRKQIEEFKK